MERVAETAPARALVGVRAVIVGTAVTTFNETGVEPPPPGKGFTTLIDTGPGVRRSDESRSTLSDVELRKLVVRLLLFTNTVDCVTKLRPVKFTSKPAVPAVAVLGFMLVTTGTPLATGVIVNIVPAGGAWFCAGNVPPPGCGVVTLMKRVLGFCSTLAGSVTIISLVLIN